MINEIPQNWIYCDEIEMLYLFYQNTDELLSESTPDSYALPLHNPITLIKEISETYSLLKKHDIIKDYYEKYIPPIIDELFQQITEDYILKNILGKRLDSIITGLTESKKSHILLDRWVSIFRQSCNIGKYINNYKQEIIKLVTETKDKDKLMYCLKNYYISLLDVGYSREYIFVTSRKFFDNNKIKIDNVFQIREFLENFSCVHKKFDFLILMDTNSVDYLDRISSKINVGQDIFKVDVEKEREQLSHDLQVSELIKQYDKMKLHAEGHQKISIVRLTDETLDPYVSAIKFCDYMSFLQTFKRYFIHYGYRKQVYKILLKKDDGLYIPLSIPHKLRKRPYVEQHIIDKRVKNILSAKSLGHSAFTSLTQALELHAYALDSKNTTTLLKSFWTALETLFSNPNANSSRDNVVNSTIYIIQKTYILKIMRALYVQIINAISFTDLQQKGIVNFKTFVQYFSSYEENSTEMKELYNLLGKNPLLRTRLFSMRKRLKDGKHINLLLENHKKRVEWQLLRLARTRNIATHIGVEVTSAECVVNHLHNYFDYIVNYMLCKSENGDYIEDVSTLVIEAKNDLSIHHEILKTDEKLSIDNFKMYLFGPDQNLINYDFEH